MSHLFFSPSLDNKKRRFKWFQCYVINLYTQHELRRPCGPQVIMETIIVTVGTEYVVTSPSSTSHGQWMGPLHLGLAPRSRHLKPRELSLQCIYM